MKERLLQFLNANQLTSTRLADQIGVQRSSISHILSGRNKPSYDFIYKLLEHYPGINPKWLILGKGAMYFDNRQASLPFEEEVSGSSPREPAIDKPSSPEGRIEPSGKDEKALENAPRHIDRIVIFYSDHSFEEYHPGKNKS